MLAVESKIATAKDAGRPHTEPPSSWKHIVEPVEPFLDAVSLRLAQQVNAFDPALAPYAEYALTGNGKHLRPTLVALAANCLGKTNDSHVTVAAIIEMVHLATLVHDDVMDEATLRRGRPTLTANWGNEISVLLGDCLFLKGEEIEDPGGIADIGARDHRQGMTTDRCNGQDVTGHSTGTRRVAGIEHQNAGRRSILGGRRHGFRGGRRFRVCHEPESGRNSVSMAGISRLASIQ